MRAYTLQHNIRELLQLVLLALDFSWYKHKRYQLMDYVQFVHGLLNSEGNGNRVKGASNRARTWDLYTLYCRSWVQA